jgi:hypothetical protein
LVPIGGERCGVKCVGKWIWYKYYVHIYVKGKMRPVETIPGMKENGDKGE